MRENMGLFHGKRKDNGEWVCGDLVHSWEKMNTKPDIQIHNNMGYFDVIPETIGECTNVPDKNGKLIFEGDIVEYNTFDDFDCYSVVKIGKYKQDGSGGEYSSGDCLGVYVEVDNFTCLDWAENDPLCFSEYLEHQNLIEVNAICEVIGNIHDNPELLKGAD